MIIGIPIPHNFAMPWEAVTSLLRVQRQIIYLEGPYIYMNRNFLINEARKQNESLLMIDSDMVYTLGDVEKIEKLVEKYPAVTGVYTNTKREPMLFKRIEGDYVLTDPPKELAPIGACGGGFLALSRELIQKLPLECCNSVKEGTVEHGEDISLCHRINQIAEVWCDPSIRLGQVRTNVIYP